MSNQSQKSKPPILRITALGFGFISLAVSLGIHFLSFVSLPKAQAPKSRTLLTKKPIKKGTVRFTVPKPPPKKELESRKIVEVVQEKTVEQPKPELARLGATTHKAVKERKVKVKNQPKAKDPAKLGMPKSKVFVKARASKKPKSRSKPRLSLNKNTVSTSVGGKSSVAAQTKKSKKRIYEQFLASSATILQNQMRQGYQDHINDEIEEGETIDLNTQEYRYIGYFTNLRKSIELTWTYPEKAWRNGLDGDVFLNFTIAQNGRVSKIKVLNSSGHQVLDHAVVEAVEGAAPFAPLPVAFGKKIKIKGNFTYSLH